MIRASAQVVKKRTLIEEAYDRLRAEILSCRILPGARLKISEIGNLLSVGPGAVREALSRLTSESLVILEPLKGFRAAPISCSANDDLIAARIEIESICVRLALVNGDDEWQKQLEFAHNQLLNVAAGSPYKPSPKWEAAHRAFHDALLSSCGNETLLQMRSNLLDRSQRYRGLARRLSRQNRDLEAEHLALYQAAVTRDIPRSIEETKNHILLTRRAVVAAMNSPEWAEFLAAQSDQPAALSATREIHPARPSSRKRREVA